MAAAVQPAITNKKAPMMTRRPPRNPAISVILIGTFRNNPQELCMRIVSLAASVVILLGTTAFAQSTAGMAAISGIVRDATGAVVPNANVVVSNDSKGIVRNLTTNDAGLFTAPALAPASG